MMAPDYMKNLTAILDDTPKEVVLTYMLWKQIQAYGNFIEADAIKPVRQFSNELAGKVSLLPGILSSELRVLTSLGSRLGARAMEILCQPCR